MVSDPIASLYNNIARVTRPFRERLRKKPEPISNFPPEFSNVEKDFVNYCYSRELTMVSPAGLVAIVTAVRHSLTNEIAGDFVECGVWRGGASLLAALLINEYQSKKVVYLFDTFEGMATPGSQDVEIRSGKLASDFHSRKQLPSHNEWAFASLEEVKNNFMIAGISAGQAVFVKGKVEETLEDPTNIPDQVSTLRLDTDWYSSTRKELEVLYPRLVAGGALLLDDYGFWDGSRRAVDEYFVRLGRNAPMLNVVDLERRIAIKAM